jgi:16S rRNA (cytosine967-C5)-methyltransferase
LKRFGADFLANSGGGALLDIQLCASEVFAETLSGRNLTLAFEDAFKRRPGMTPQARAAVREICYDGLRALGLIEAQLAVLLAAPIRHAALRHLLIVALAQLQFSRAKPYAVVDHAVQAAERLGQPAARGLVNAVLRTFLRKREEFGPGRFSSPEARFGFPGWWVEKVRDEHPRCWEAMLESANLHPPLTLRVNTRRGTLSDYLALLESNAIAGEPIGPAAVRIAPRPVREIPGFAQGRVSVQDAGAQLAAPLLDATEGQRVLDACAAPGGKTTHLLELADVQVTAVDNDSIRLARIRENLDRLGFTAALVAADAANPAAWWDGRRFDRVLLDAPCSASGVTRRHPDIRWNRRPGDLGRFAAQQASLLDGVWQVLERSGKLLYATCSVFREENQSAVEAFLSRQRDATLIPLDPDAFPGGQVLPDEQRDGFFYALLEKR